LNARDGKRRVQPGEAATVRPTFERPSGERGVTLRATWLVTSDTAADRGVAIVIPVTLPVRGAVHDR
jgi:hypothetical protein